MLLIENVSINYKSKNEIRLVIKNLSIEIDKGEALVILGSSGCGKSTLINALSKTIPIECGNVKYIQNNNINNLSTKIHKIGIIPQNCGLLPWKTVEENCLLPLKIRHEEINDELKNNIYKIFESLNISSLLERYPRELSGGQIQMAAIARALFLKMWKLYKPTTVLVTHSIDEALYLGNRILVMGIHMGNIKYEINNPYFEQIYPEELEYIYIKRILREKLKSIEGDFNG